LAFYAAFYFYIVLAYTAVLDMFTELNFFIDALFFNLIGQILYINKSLPMNFIIGHDGMICFAGYISAARGEWNDNSSRCNDRESIVSY